MEMNMEKKVTETRLKHLKRRKWYKAVAVLACFVVFCTTYALILPAITMEADVYCGIEASDEHIHSLICYSDHESDVETAQDWENTLPGELTGNWNEDIIAVAESQIGYAESILNYEVGETDEEKRGYTRYGEWYGDPYGDWNAMFVSFCLNYAEVPSEMVPYGNNCTEWVQQLKTLGIFEDAKDAVPAPGDLIFLDMDEESECSGRAGVVKEIISGDEADEIHIITVNADKEVQYETQKLSKNNIAGYVSLEKIQKEQTMIPLDEETADTTMPLSEGDRETISDEAISEPANTYFLEGDSRTAQMKVTVRIKKKWADETDIPENVTMHLFKDGTDTGQTLILNESNQWSGSWTNLPNDGTYTVKEDKTNGWYAEMMRTEEDSTGGTYWIPMTKFEEGEVFAIVCNSTSALTPAAKPDRSIVVGYYDVVKGTDAILVSGRKYTDYLSEVPDYAQWQADASGLQSKIYNVYLKDYGLVNNYLNLTGNMAALTQEAQAGEVNISWAGTGYQYKIYNSNNYWLKGDNTFTSDWKDATAYTLYKKITQENEKIITYDVINWRDSQGNQTPSKGVELEHKKTIDAFRDDIDNTDTSLDTDAEDKEDLYRIYLDVLAKVESAPVDLLIVVDRSNSMSNIDVPYRYTDTDGTEREKDIRRYEAVNMILNGEDDSGGLLASLLAMNPNNKVAVTSYCGKGPYDEEYTYKLDSKVLLDWTSDINEEADATYEPNSGTNYAAGLESASALFDADLVKNDGNKKIMIFLSDGVPSFYIDEAGTLCGDASGTPTNIEQCREPTKRAFDKFHLSHPEVTTYTIGISKDINGDGDGENTDPEVLRYMAARGGGSFFGIADENEFMGMMQEIIQGYSGELKPVKASITDTLSQYVEIHSTKPDYKLTMTDSQGNITILYENGSITKDGEDVVESIAYTPAEKPLTDSTGIVKVTFKPEYALIYGNKYTLSFNVNTTQKAYETYAENRDSGADGYGGVTGDPDTDYDSNTTSSEKPGFPSNSEAVLQYTQNKTEYEFEYDHPVVQVSDCSLKIKKVSKDNKNILLPGAKFDLYREAKAEETGVAVEGLTGYYIKINDASMETGSSGMVQISNLTPGIYYLKETAAPEGYSLLTAPIQITLEKTSVSVPAGSDSSGITGETVTAGRIPTLTVSNSSGVLLPETGGNSFVPYTAAGILIIAGACLMYRNYVQERRKRKIPALNEQRKN